VKINVSPVLLSGKHGSTAKGVNPQQKRSFTQKVCHHYDILKTL